MRRKLSAIAMACLAGLSMSAMAGNASTSMTVQEQSKSPAISDAAFLKANAKKPGVVTLPSGLQYKVITKGTGAQPMPTSTVTVDYEGKLVNGTVFDSSYKRGQPISFALNQVIPGWTEGVGLMHAGETAILYIPGNLAYGEQGVPGTIPPNATLVFKIHLISVSN